MHSELQRQRYREVCIERNTTHGMAHTRLYNVWCAMKSRCYNTNNPQYGNYGASGITVCEEWRSDFVAFREWAIFHGYDESAPRGKCTIDRINVNGGYCPENCRIATQMEQNNNRRDNRYFELNGEAHTLPEWSRTTGLNIGTLRDRVRHGWSIEDALTTPAGGRHHAN